MLPHVEQPRRDGFFVPASPTVEQPTSLEPCQGCQAMVDRTAKACPKCGRPHPTPASRWNLIIGVVAAVAILGFIAAHGLGGMNPAVSPTAGQGVSAEAFNRVQAGMSLEEVQQILGAPGAVISRTDMAGFTALMVQWNGSGNLGANMNAMFQNGRLISKAQFGLR